MTSTTSAENAIGGVPYGTSKNAHATSQLGPKGDARGRDCFGGAKIPRLEIAIKD